MASIYDIKPAFQNLLRPLTRSLAADGVTANQVTILAAIFSIAVGACIFWQPLARWPLLVLPAFLFVRMALNAIDGMLAREHGQKSPLGAILNEIGDVVADTALYLPLARVPGPFARWAAEPCRERSLEPVLPRSGSRYVRRQRKVAGLSV